MNIDYNKELKKAIGWEIKAGRKEKYVQNKTETCKQRRSFMGFRCKHKDFINERIMRNFNRNYEF